MKTKKLLIIGLVLVGFLAALICYQGRKLQQQREVGQRPATSAMLAHPDFQPPPGSTPQPILTGQSGRVSRPETAVGQTVPESVRPILGSAGETFSTRLRAVKALGTNLSLAESEALIQFLQAPTDSNKRIFFFKINGTG